MKYIMAIPIFIRFFVSIGRVYQKYHRIEKAKLVKRENIRRGAVKIMLCCVRYLIFRREVRFLLPDRNFQLLSLDGVYGVVCPP